MGKEWDSETSALAASLSHLLPAPARCVLYCASRSVLAAVTVFLLLNCHGLSSPHPLRPSDESVPQARRPHQGWERPTFFCAPEAQPMRGRISAPRLFLGALFLRGQLSYRLRH